MFFEGSEKKIELRVKRGSRSLRSYGRAFWDRGLAFAGADILSVMSNDDCDAYILSESSLFVWENKLLLITCGNTNLVEAGLFLIDEMGVDDISSFNYQRKSEFLSHLQSTHFEDDAKQLQSRLNGSAYRVGHLDGHHHYLFCSETSEKLCSSTSLLMYHIKGDVADYLRQANQTKSMILSKLNLHRLLPDFIFDDHLFDPCGYSVNGLNGEQFLTIHITPQAQSAYVSIETNLNFQQYSFKIFTAMLNIFNPISWDVIGVNQDITARDFSADIEVASCDLQLNTTNNINYKHYIQAVSEKLTAQIL
ncbi:S-adenosylmethionine decarboxylase proenzyme [Shewanella abyssi]|uniref:S-adenosylmethionine decarboxylase proenzyme n=1 Tax=Shewanella abyssi TaxID=311789 RepID=UPI00200C0177|nr:S-adenosylmethionine decarboxylase proenzyme [Shewanella abyssi]MCL1050612.1 S-adenosylmethionine decarboxylase proenzyme [Shewanella abyssi]